MTTLRETVAAMPAEERLEYVLACWEMITGEDAPLPMTVDGVALTEQQARIFAMLQRGSGHAVSTDRLVAMLNASRPDADTTANGVVTQISLMRRKLYGKYTIRNRYFEGYTLERVA